MKKKKLKTIISVSLLLIIGLIIFINIPLKKRDYTYDPQKAIEYSYNYIDNRNPDFPNFEKNCVTFVSQCLLAGGIEMDERNIEPISKNKVLHTSNLWFCYSFDTNPYRPISYYLSSSFSNNRYFLSYWKNVADVPCYTVENTEEGRNTLKDSVKLGDVILLRGDVPHCAIVVKIDEQDVYYNSNTNNRREYPLSRVSESEYPKITYMNFVK